MEGLEMIKGKKILVTGGTGFIGGHLTETLVENGAKVVVVDIVLPFNSYFSQKKLKNKSKLELVDIRTRKNILKIFAKYLPDYVFHLAAEPIVVKGFDNPYKTFQTNIMGTVNVLDASMQAGVKGIIVASSDKAYGKTKSAYTEESPLRGDHPYDVSKSAADLISQTYFSSYNLPVVITRFGNVYGEGDLHLDRIIPGICRAVVKNEKLQIRSDGTYVRDYIYVKDVVEGYLALFNAIHKIHGEAYNFSSKDTFSVLDLIKHAEQILKTKVSYDILNIAKNEIPYQHLDDRKIKKLGWSNRFRLDDVFPKVLDWYVKLYHNG